MIYANTNVYTDKENRIAILTRTDANRTETFLVNDRNPEDVSINFDRRLIEFYLANPAATYREWDKLLFECGYEVSLFEKEYPKVKDPTGLYYDELMEHYDDPVEGFKITYIPTGMFVRIGMEPVYEEYGNYIGERQIVLAYSKEDFIET